MVDSQETYYVITASRLLEGDVVYMIRGDDETCWTTDIAAASTFATVDRGNAIALAEAGVASNLVVGPYAIEITGKNIPLGTKEKIRSEGPTVAFGPDSLPSNNPDYSI